MKARLSAFVAKLPLPGTEKWPHGVWDIEAMRHGSMSVILFTPRVADFQTTHDQDELYVIQSGHGVLRIGQDNVVFEPGDVLFVAAGVDHRFETFSEDTVTWAIFWGPKGGEQEPSPPQ